MVRVYDIETNTVTTIPAEELAPGMVQVQIQGQEGLFWVDASRLQRSQYRHPPFSEDMRDHLREIQNALNEVYPQTLEFWEDGFRRDTHPQREIANWLHMARTYRDFVQGRSLNLEQKREVFDVLVACSNGPRENVFQITSLSSLSRADAEEVVRAFYEGA